MKQFFLSLRSPKCYPGKITDDRLLIWWMIILVLARLWLVEAQDFLATYTPHDDYLFIHLARSILSGQWLGSYNQVTLVKGPGYPLFIAFAHHTGLPLLLVQQLLYSFLSVIVVIALRPLVKNRWPLVILFALILLNPFMYNYPASGRAFRLGLSMPLVLAVFGCMIGLMARVHGTFWNRFIWAGGFGFSFSLLWYTREEGIWLLPSVALFALLYLVSDPDKPILQLLQRIMVLIWICVIFAGFYGTFAYMNYKYYGHAVINELKSPEFQSALGGLMNIDTESTRRYVPVGRKAQKLAFSVSPTFNLLQPTYKEHIKGAQMPSSFYIWVFRDMVRKAGYAESLTDALGFYGKMGQELKDACRSGEISCLDREPTLVPPWRSEYNKYIVPYFTDIFVKAVTFKSFRCTEYRFTKWSSSATREMVRDYRYVTNEVLVPSSPAEIQKYPDFYQGRFWIRCLV